MIYRAVCSRINSQFDEQFVFLDAYSTEKASQRLGRLLALIWQCDEADIEAYNLHDEVELRSYAYLPDAGDQFLLEVGWQKGEPLYCTDPLLLVGPRSLARLRAALAAVATVPTPTQTTASREDI